MAKVTVFQSLITGLRRLFEYLYSIVVASPACPSLPKDSPPMPVSSETERSIVLDAVALTGYPREEVDATISLESGWKPDAVNPASGASGLIQFMPFVLKALGWPGTPEAFRALSTTEQAPWVAAYFANYANRWRHPGDTYLAVAAPAYLGLADETVVYKRGSKAWTQNPGWRDSNGEITVGSIRQVLLRRMRKGKQTLPLA